MAGLHGMAERCPHGVTVYLLPGLTGEQRKAVIRRLRQESGRGCGPVLPLPQLVIALAVDRVRVAVGLAAAIVRLHPAAALPSTAVVATAMALFVLAPAGVGQGTGSVQRPALAGALTGVGYAGLAVVPSGSIGAGLGSAGSAISVGGAIPGGRGLGSGQPAVAGTRSWHPHAARVCFGAMPGAGQNWQSQGAAQLDCRRVGPYRAHRPGPRNLGSVDLSTGVAHGGLTAVGYGGSPSGR